MDDGIELVARDIAVARGARVVLSGVSVTLRAGERVALLGPNGAGKSTLLKALAGLLPATGELRLGRDAIARLSPAERARRIAYVPQHSALSAPVPVWAVVAQGRFAHRASWQTLARDDRTAIDDAMALVDVGSLADRPFSELSYGERRRVLLARALATHAPLVLLDEPTAALDVGHALSLFAVLNRLADAGRGVLVVLHQLSEAMAFAERALLLANGRVVAAGATNDVITPSVVRAHYGVDMIAGGGLGFRLPADPERAP